MEKRFFLALLLTGAVMMLTPVLFPRPNVPVSVTNADTVASGSGTSKAEPPVGAAAVPAVSGTALSRAAPARAAHADSLQTASAETVSVHTDVSSYVFSTLGATPIAVQADSYPALQGKGGRVVLRYDHEPLLRFRVLTAGDTIHLDRTAFTVMRGTRSDGAATLTFSGQTGKVRASIRYEFPRDNYLITTAVELSDIGGPAFLLVDLPSGFDTQEADSVADHRSLAYSVKPFTQGARGTAFAKLDAGEQKLEPGPLRWAVAKSKYFLVGLLVPEGGKPFAEVHLQGGVRTQKIATNGNATVVLPLEGGKATFEVYAGPQSWERLHRLGREFETANPYGGFMQPVVQPFATIVMRVLLWMKRQVRLNYGWVLVIFGISIRLLLWPLNQGAMRTSIKMQRIQPELTEVQKRYKSDPQKQQQEIMRVYREHGMSPFSAFSGCLPMLLPMPVFFALFFVFQNTIEFRGVPFLWMTDISLPDPLYIVPLVMGASMFLLSWIGMRNAPPNPQAKMMMYMLPAMFTVFLLGTAAGLSIYYLTSNLASLPQQWLIANERAKAKSGS
jgi:YidC/Oxa1 family membrane protein insertase